MREFNDRPHHEPNHWPSARLTDLFRVSRLLQRSGMRNVTVLPEVEALHFSDPLINAFVVLTVEPWSDGESGWCWYATVDIPKRWSAGSLCEGRRILDVPWPGEVVRAYRQFTWYERTHWGRPKRKRK